MSSGIEAGIFRSLEAVAEASSRPGTPGADGLWTRNVKEALCRLGRSRGCKVAASGCDQATHGEWLFDLAWYRDEEGVSWSLRGLALVVESEWSMNFGDVAWDFEKLLVARCPVKLMVYQQRSEGDVLETASRLRAMVERYEPDAPCGRYLLAGHALDRERFHVSVAGERTEDGSVPLARWTGADPAERGFAAAFQ